MANRNEIVDKQNFRSRQAKRRDELPTERRAVWSVAACRHMASFLDHRAVESLMAYIPFRSELDLSALIEWGWARDKDIIIPRCVVADRSMTLHRLRSWDQLASGAYGIKEPNPDLSPALALNAIPKVIIVPGLAFDLKGGRLGYGGGYYDRFAAACKSDHAHDQPMIWIGAAFEEQLVDEVPLEVHDVRMDGIVTEKGVYWTKR